jgi:cell division transport system permease protein
MSKSESLKEARVLLANRPAALRVIEDDPSIVPASLRIKPVDPDDYQTIVTRAEAMPGLLSVESAAEAIDGMISLRDGLQIMSLFLAVALGIAAVALIANTIHMAIYSRREEIEIMNLVGASNWFVRTPFLLEGAFEGFVGAGLAVLVVVGGLRIASNQLTELPDWINIGIQSDYLARNGALVLIFGVVAGLAGSGLSLAVHKYLRT